MCKRNSFLWFILPRWSVISIWACNLLRESWFWLTQKTCFMKHNATHQYWHQMWCVFGLTASAGCVLAWRSKSHSFNSGVWVHRTSLSQLASDTVGLMWFLDSRWLVSVLNSCSLWHNATDRGSCFTLNTLSVWAIYPTRVSSRTIWDDASTFPWVDPDPLFLWGNNNVRSWLTLSHMFPSRAWRFTEIIISAFSDAFVVEKTCWRAWVAHISIHLRVQRSGTLRTLGFSIEVLLDLPAVGTLNPIYDQ